MIKRKDQEAFLIEDNPKKVKYYEIIRSFYNKNMENLILSHENPSVIVPIINDFKLQRVLVDTREWVDILYWDTFKNMGFNEENLKPNRIPIKGFGQVRVPIASKYNKVNYQLRGRRTINLKIRKVHISKI